MADVNLGREAMPQPPGFENGTSTGWESYKPSSSSNGWSGDQKWESDQKADQKWEADKKWGHDKWADYSRGGGAGNRWGNSERPQDSGWQNGGRGSGYGNGLVGEENAHVEIHGEVGEVEVIKMPETEMLLSSESFSSFGLTEPVLQGIYAMGYVKPSIIQAYTLPRILGKSGQPGHSLLAQAQNGSGKTACFSIAVLHALDTQVRQPQAMVLCPTRELAKQNYDYLTILGSAVQPILHLVCPGMERVRTGSTIAAHVVIGTPGKTQDMLKKRFISRNAFKVFVLDEADVMLDEENGSMGAQVIEVRRYLPQDMQILFFSATYPDNVHKFSNSLLRDKIVIKVSKEALTVASIRQMYKVCEDEADKFHQLTNIYGALNVGQSIVFVNARRKAFDLAQRMQDEGHYVSLICGSQGPTGEEAMLAEERDKVMGEFRGGVTRVLVATDVLARGIDVPQVTLVVNYEMPIGRNGNHMATYLHRVGRTGRFGLKGVAVNLVTADEIAQVQEVMDHYQCKIMEIDYDWEEFEARLTNLRVDDKPNGEADQAGKA